MTGRIAHTEYSSVMRYVRVRVLVNYKYLNHKVLTYVEYRAVSGVFQTIDPPPPRHSASVSYPRTKGGGGGWYTLAGR
jgi:hypothetical protein